MAGLPTTNVQIPLGGGIDAASHEWAAQPPNAVGAENLDLRALGAYQKRPGFTAESGAPTYGQLLVPQKRAFAAYDDSGATILAGGDSTAQEFGGLVPTQIVRHNVYAFAGAISNAQVAQSGGYFGIALTESDPQYGLNAVLMILDANWQIVWGPHRVAQLAHFPRVEPVKNGTETGFIFLGSTGVSPGFGSGPDGVGEDAQVDLWAVYADHHTPAPSPTLLVTMLASNKDGAAQVVVYDSYGLDTVSKIVLAYRKNASGNCYTATLDASMTLTEAPDVIVNGTGGGMAVWYDAPSDTVLTYYEGSPNLLRYWPLDFSSSSVVVVSPAPVGDVPCFFKESGGFVTRFNDRTVTFFGNSPGTPSLTVGSGFKAVYHRRPQPRPHSGAYYFSCYTKSDESDFGDRLVTGGAEIRGVGVSTLTGGGITDEHIIVPLNETRTDLYYFDHFHHYRWSSGGISYARTWGTVGQSARGDDAVYVPQIVVNNAYLTPPLWKAGDRSVYVNNANYGLDPTSTFDAIGAPSAVVHREGPAGLDEGVSQLVIEEIIADAPEYSHLDFYGTTLVAAGGLTAFDGTLDVPAYVEKPLGYTLAPNEGTSRPHPEGEFSSAWASLMLDNGKSIDFKGVLFHIDRNGVKYRSEPFDLGTVSNGQPAARFYAPVWTLKLRASHKPAILGGRRLGLEVYCTDEYSTGGDPSVAFTLIYRAAVKYDSGSKTYVVDGTNIYDPSDGTNTWDTLGFNPTPLYTDSGELGPIKPPAAQVIARAGDFIFLLSSEDPYDILHTKPLDNFIGPEFNALLRIAAPPESGGVVSLAGESDRLIILCANGAYELYVASTTPDSSGSGSFPSLRTIYSGEGCVSHAGTVTGPFGTFFVSESGPKIIGRDGSLNDIGRALGAIDTSAITRSVYHVARQEVWLFTSTGAYIYDLSAQAWTTSTLTCDAAVSRDGRLYRMSGGVLLKSDTSAATDNGTAVLAKYVSPWIRLDTAMGYKRIKEVGVLIKLRSSGTGGKIRISLAYDYVDTNIDSKSWARSAYTAFERPIQLRLKPSRQKCDAIRITVDETTETIGQGQEAQVKNDILWDLVAIELKAATKGGVIRLEAGAKG